MSQGVYVLGGQYLGGKCPRGTCICPGAGAMYYNQKFHMETLCSLLCKLYISDL